MGLWIEFHQTLRHHPKTRRLSTRLKVSKAATLGHLGLLWLWCLDFAQDGDLSGYEDQEIADAAEWEGDAVSFVEALINCNPRAGRPGFLDRTADGRLLVNDWDDYAGKLIDRRRQNAEKQRAYRERQAKPDKEGDPPAVTDTLPLRSGATVPDRTVPNQPHTTNPGGRARIECEATTYQGEPMAFTEWFDSIYPRKEDRPGALAAWKSVAPDNQTTAAIYRDTRTRLKSPQWQEQGGRFIQKPANYLRARTWEDKGIVGVPKDRTTEQVHQDALKQRTREVVERAKAAEAERVPVPDEVKAMVKSIRRL